MGERAKSAEGKWSGGQGAAVDLTVFPTQAQGQSQSHSSHLLPLLFKREYKKRGFLPRLIVGEASSYI